MRMLRAGAFMLTLEKRLDDCGDGSLQWEYTVARGRPGSPLSTPYFGVLDPDHLRLIAVTLLFLTLAAASSVLGWDGASAGGHIFAVVVGVIAVTVLVLLYRLRVHQLVDIVDGDHQVRSPCRERPWFSRLSQGSQRSSHTLIPSCQ
jgi:hypothetical protein